MFGLLWEFVQCRVVVDVVWPFLELLDAVSLLGAALFSFLFTHWLVRN